MAAGGSFEKDDDFCKRVLRKVRTKFVEDVTPVSLVDVFLEEDYITNTQARDIQENELTSNRNRIILDIVSTKGVKGYNRFKEYLKKSRQEHLAEHLDTVEEQIQNSVEADEETRPNQDKGYKCIVCNVSCDDLQLLDAHVKTTQHLDMIKKQQRFAENFTEEKNEPEIDATLPTSIIVQNSYSDYCYLCRIKLTSQSHASSHLNGRSHMKKQAQFDATGQESVASFETDSFNALQQPADGAVDVADSRCTLPLESLESEKRQQTENCPKSDLSCDICNVPFTGPENAKQHYNSDRHKKKELMMQKQQEGRVLPFNCSTCNCTFSGEENAEAHFNSEKHKKKANKGSESVTQVTPFVKSSNNNPITKSRENTALFCNICQVAFTGPESAAQHYDSAKHKKKELLNQKMKQGEALPLSCDICKCSFSGQENAEAHFKSARHLKKKRDSGAGSLPMLPCTVLSRSFTGQEDAKGLSQNMTYRQKEEHVHTPEDRTNDLDRSFRGSGELEQGSFLESDDDNLAVSGNEKIEDTITTDLEQLSLGGK